mmetsp:Transcript_43436/g.91226  ORF Transcript_43436/g.91226 Transcript_43436/m.91226 type:complete len:492 (-) Transcript_43436:557-2032(-)
MTRRSGRICRKPKRSLQSSAPTKCSPYFRDPKRRPKHLIRKLDFDNLGEKTKDLNDSSAESSSALWTPTDELPSHLVGSKYFDKTTTYTKDEKRSKEINLLVRTNTPMDFSLSQAVCSYGYFCLAPNRWVPGKPIEDGSTTDSSCGIIGRGAGDDEGYLVRPLTYHCGNTAGKQSDTAMADSKTALVAVGQDPDTNSVLVAIHSPVLIDGEDEQQMQQQLTNQIDRMVRLNTSLETFHELYPEAKERGFGRLYRSPTLFEDIIKTITNCNMQWGGTVEMNAKLCKRVGSDGAFPTPEEIRKVGPDFLKEHCRVGYRGKYIWNLANEVVEGRLDMVRDLGSDPNGDCHHDREDVQNCLLKFSGIGPFAANNILQLMGYSDTHPYDTETVRLWKEEFGASTCATKVEVFGKAKAHYSQYKTYAFTAYWYDLWKNYERRAGIRSPQWSIEQLEKERPTSVVSDHNCVFAHPSRTSKVSKRSKVKSKKKDDAANV